tara:strand:- start:653 stop:1063 length:411 start_codon:yes stop_codon:yes gene_type:complete
MDAILNTLFDFLFTFPAIDWRLFVARIVVFPLIILIIYYLCYSILMQIFKRKEDGILGQFLVRSSLFKIYSALFCLIPLNIYWWFLISHNTTNIFAWLFWPWTLANTYLQLIPFILCVLAIIMIYVSNINRIKNIL